MIRQPKFSVGDVVRVLDPERFLAAYSNKYRDRDVVVLANLLDYGRANERVYQGRMRVEFQKRNGRGKVFCEVMNEHCFVAKTEL